MRHIYLKKYNIEYIAAYILGFSTSVYVAYFAIIGNTAIRFDMVVSIFLFLILIFKKSAFQELASHFNKYILMFSVFLLVSGFMAFYYSLYLGHIDRYAKALIIYLVSILTYSCVILLKNNKQAIIKGMLSGLILNIVFSIIQYITFSNGKYFTLFNIFPQSSFYIPIYNFRTQGLFLEPSHMMQYITSTAIIFLVCYKVGLRKNILIVFLIFVILLSKSSNAIVLLCMLALYFIIRHKAKRLVFKISSIILFIIVSILILVNINFFSRIIYQLDITNLIDTIFNGTDLSSEGNVDRVAGMGFALDLIKQYPLGIGYGMSKTIFDMYDAAITSFNYLLTLQLELGIIGSILYLMRIYSMGFKLVTKKINNYQIALGLSIIGSEICAILNGGYFGQALWVLYGLASIELYSAKSNFRKTISPKD